jgi:RNA-binding protein
MTLTGAQKTYLRGLGQTQPDALKIGREGASAAVLKELTALLAVHELVKVRFVGADRVERAALCETLASGTESVCVGAVGHTALFYREQPDPEKRRIQV